MDMESLTSSYTNAILAQCANINSQLSDLDSQYINLVAIQATYDAFKYYVGQVHDIKTQQQIFKVIEFDAKNLVYPVEPTTNEVGHG